jgi:hypothetical protein
MLTGKLFSVFSVKLLSLFLTALLLVACSERPPQSEMPFVTTPELVTGPQFLATPPETGAYPEPADDQIGYPVPSDLPQGYPAVANRHSIDGRSRSALQSYETALSVALEEFSPEAQLYTISPSGIMLINLGNPPVLPGWFYTFRKPDSRREFIVQVVDDFVTGTTLTEAMVDIGPGVRPIEVHQIKLDSTQVLVQFEEVAKSRQIWKEGTIYDLELVNLEGTAGPIWSVVEPVTHMWLYSVNAISGEEVRSPYEQ